MSRRGFTIQQQEQPAPVRRVFGSTLVEHIYKSILQALESNANIRDVYDRYMPMLLNEIEILAMQHPITKDLFVDTFNNMWGRWFRNIPTPSIEPEESVTLVQTKVYETLRKHVEKIDLTAMSGRASLTTIEMEDQLRYLTLQFMESVCRYVFRVMGVLG